MLAKFFSFIASLFIISSPPVTNLALPTRQPTPSKSVSYAAWLPYWDQINVKKSLAVSSSYLSAIHPFFYRLNSESVLEEIPGAKFDVASYNRPLIPVIGNDFDPKRITMIFDNPKKQSQLISQLSAIASAQHYSGWDIDWEQVAIADRDKFTSFIKDLSSELHSKGFQLSVSVHSQTGINDWQGSLGQDWKALSESADEIIIMAYDFHNSGTQAGPISPLDEIEQVIIYARQQIPATKIVLGLPLYGYDWRSNTAVPVTFLQIQELLKNPKITSSRDHISHEQSINYQDVSGIDHEIWFQDANSIISKVQLAQKFGITKFCFWRLGGEDPTIWLTLPR